MATKTEEKKGIVIEEIKIQTLTVTIEGTSDLVLNQMNARNTRAMERLNNGEKKVKEVPNKWEDIITAIKWKNPLNMTDTYTECTEEKMYELLKENQPCISAFGLKKSFGQAVVRNGIDKYATKIDNALNINAMQNKIPITFAQWSLDERLMSPQKGSPVLVRLNHFSGWRAEFQISFTENIYNAESIVNIINLAGFGLGIGSGRSSGYGRYKVVDVR